MDVQNVILIKIKDLDFFNLIHYQIDVKLIKEDFLNVKYDESKIENAKVILVNAPCSKSALMNPMEFLFEEGEG